MQVFISIDDTDNQHSPGSGHLAEHLSKKLIEKGLAGHCSTISRHQLYLSPDIPLTSHNSAMCFTATIDSGGLTGLINFSGGFLKESSASGSDPGLCVVNGIGTGDIARIVDFGMAAKTTVLSKDLAYELAGDCGVHLSEHGGTGDGVIGALAGVGLRMQGSDGRIRGWLDLNAAGETVTIGSLTSHSRVDGVVDQDGSIIHDETAEVLLTEDRLKTVMQDGLQVISVLPLAGNYGPVWRTLEKSAVKLF